MGKGIKRAAKNSKDFAKKKAKVGRKLDKANNDTTVDVRVRQLNLPSQHALDGNDTVPTDESNHSLKVCCPIPVTLSTQRHLLLQVAYTATLAPIRSGSMPQQKINVQHCMSQA